MAHLFTQSAHLGITTGIVGDRSVGVGGQGDTQRREHTYGSDADAIEAVGQTLRRHREVEAVGKEVTQHNGHANGDDGDAGRDHTRTDTLDDHGGSTCLACLRDLLCGLVGVGGVVFGGLTDDHTGSQTRDDGEGEAQPVLNTQEVEDGEGGDGNEHGTHVGAKGERTEQIPHRSALLGAYEEDAKQREEHAHRGNQHRGDDRLQLDLQTCHAEGCSA